MGYFGVRAARGGLVGLALAALIAGCSLTGSGTAKPTPEKLDIEYINDGSTAHKLDLYLPEGKGPGPFPVVIWVHGGGWSVGDKSDIVREGEIMSNETVQLMRSKGYAVAAPNYRLVPEARFPVPMQDVAASVRYLRANAGELDLDPERFALMGDSAGAHLAAMVALTPTNAQLQGKLGDDPDTDTSVRAFVGYYGLYDLTRRSGDQKDMCGQSQPGAESSHGQLVNTDPNSPEGEPLAAEASPITYVEPNSPPTLLFSGSEDCTAPPVQAERYAAALEAAGVPTGITLIPTGHADARFFQDPALQDQLIKFLDAHVKD